MKLELDIEIGDTVFKGHHKYTVEEIDIKITENSYKTVETSIRFKIIDKDNYVSYVYREDLKAVKEYKQLIKDILEELGE